MFLHSLFKFSLFIFLTFCGLTFCSSSFINYFFFLPFFFLSIILNSFLLFRSSVIDFTRFHVLFEFSFHSLFFLSFVFLYISDVYRLYSSFLITLHPVNISILFHIFLLLVVSLSSFSLYISVYTNTNTYSFIVSNFHETFLNLGAHAL